MDNQSSPRRHIWALRGQKAAAKEPLTFVDQSLPASRATGALRGERKEGFAVPERPRRSNLLDVDLAAPALIFPAFDDTILMSLYDHRMPIAVELPGRCTMPNGRSTTCKTTRISSESVDLVYDLKTVGYPMRHPQELPLGATIHLDLDQIGNFHGAVTGQNADGFQLAVDVDCKGKLIPKLARVAAAIAAMNSVESAAIAKSAIVRIEPIVQGCSFTDHSGALRRGKIINISRIDALVKAALIPPIASHIVFGGIEPYEAEVTRTFEIGFMVQFCAPIPETRFSRSIKLLND
jgi:hypothetical protein